MTDTEDTELITDRRAVYGDPEDTFIRIAQVWTGILGHEIQPWEVPLLMEGMKIVRTQICPDYSDNSDDIDGYNDIFKLLIGEDMIHARTVDEYLRIKKERKKTPRDYWPADHVHKTIPYTIMCACGAQYDTETSTWSEMPDPPRRRHYSDYLSED